LYTIDNVARNVLHGSPGSAFQPLAIFILDRGLALAVSFLATLYPAWNATKIAPAEVLRYE
jgi:ABC-type lipoprotein release transport system permease subunit